MLNLIYYNNSKDGDNNIKSDKRNYDFKIFRFFNLNGVEDRENIIIINEF